MRARNESSTSKSQAFRKEIRQRQISQLLSTRRHELPCLTRQQCLQKLKCNFMDIHEMLQDKQINLYGNHQLQILLKQLREISCSFVAPDAFHFKFNMQALVELSNRGSLDRCCQIALFEILLNLSAESVEQEQGRSCSKYAHLQLEQLPISQKLATSDGELLDLTIKIVGNFLQKDKTSRTIYYLLTKLKVLEACIKILIDRKQMYELSKIKPTFLWFANKLITSILRFKFEAIDRDYDNFKTIVGEEMVKAFEKCHRDKQNGEYDPDYGIVINDVLVYVKNLIKAEAVEVTEELIEMIESYFSPINPYYLDLLGSLTCRTLYTLSLPHTQALLNQLLTHPSHPHAHRLLRCLANSLTNDSTHWRVVMNHFIEYSTRSPLEYDPVQVNNKKLEEEYESYSLLMFFLYFLNRSSTESDMAEIIGIIICGQSGLGIFQDGIQDLAESAYLARKLESFGFEIE